MTPAVWPWCYHHDSTVQYRILYPSSTPLSPMNLLSPGMLGFFVDQVSGKDQAAWTDTPHLRPSYVHSVFDRSRTYPMVLLGGDPGVTGPMTEAVIGGLNTAHVTLGVVLVPWNTAMYEHATMSVVVMAGRRPRVSFDATRSM